MMRRHVVILASLLMKEKHALVVGDAVVLHIHRDDSPDPSEGVEHCAADCSQCPDYCHHAHRYAEAAYEREC